MPIKKFDYKNTPISFEFSDGNKMINATEMAKPFGKLVADFLRLKSTRAFIPLLEKRYGNSHIAHKREVIRVVKGGKKELQVAHDERFGRVRTYHQDVLKEIIA